MDDRALVAAMVGRDPRGLEGAYRRYADRLLAYCRGLLRDEQAAADAVHDTFILASERAGQLREPQRLRAWLYAIAHNECLRQLRGRSRHLPLEEVSEVSAPPSDPGAAVHADQVRELVWAAAAALNPGDRQVFELMVRHELSAADVAAVLGISTDHAHARLSRARAQLERALAALLVARTGGRDCAGLAQLLRGWNGVLSTLQRKRIGRHVEGCSVCTRRQHEQLRPAALLSAYAGLPFLAAPDALWSRIRRTSAPAGPQAGPDTVVPRAEFDAGTGFPKPGGARHGRSARAAAAAVAALALLVGAALLGPHLALTGEPELEAGPPSALPTPTAAAPESTLTAQPPAAVRSPPAASPVRSARPEPTRSRPASRPAPAPLTVRATGRVTPDPCPQYRLIVAAVASEQPLAAATLHWQAGTTAPRTVPMTVAGATAYAEVPRLSGSVTWWVEIATSYRRTARSAPSTLDSPCR
jgi:RNA polymerase sigma factor (sigma-70 family)